MLNALELSKMETLFPQHLKRHILTPHERLFFSLAHATSLVVSLAKRAEKLDPRQYDLCSQAIRLTQASEKRCRNRSKDISPIDQVYEVGQLIAERSNYSNTVARLSDTQKETQVLKRMLSVLGCAYYGECERYIYGYAMIELVKGINGRSRQEKLDYLYSVLRSRKTGSFDYSLLLADPQEIEKKYGNKLALIGAKETCALARAAASIKSELFNGLFSQTAATQDIEKFLPELERLFASGKISSDGLVQLLGINDFSRVQLAYRRSQNKPGLFGMVRNAISTIAESRLNDQDYPKPLAAYSEMTDSICQAQANGVVEVRSTWASLNGNEIPLIARVQPQSGKILNWSILDDPESPQSQAIRDTLIRTVKMGVNISQPGNTDKDTTWPSRGIVIPEKSKRKRNGNGGNGQKLHPGQPADQAVTKERLRGTIRGLMILPEVNSSEWGSLIAGSINPARRDKIIKTLYRAANLMTAGTLSPRNFHKLKDLGALYSLRLSDSERALFKFVDGKFVLMKICSHEEMDKIL